MTLRSLFSAVSGVRNHQTRIDVIGNNISNVNTVGYKSGRVTFQDIFSQTIRGARPSQGSSGGTNPVQVGLGSRIGTIDTLFSQGNFQTTGRTFDLAIEGGGYFTLSNTDRSVGQKFYTRAGNFDIDSRGYLVNPSNGYFVQGLLANPQGQIDRTQPPQAIQVDFGAVSPAVVTRNIALGGNLDSNVQPQAATGLTNLRALFNEDGDVGNLRIGDVIQFATGTIGATSLANVSIMTVQSNSTLQSLAEAIQSRLQSSGTGDETVIINSDGTLRITTGTAAIADVTFEVVDVAGAAGVPRAAQTAFLNSVLNDGDGDIDIAANDQVNTASYFRQADVTTSIDVFDSQGNARTVTVAFAKDTTQNNVYNWQAVVPHTDGNAATGSFPTGDTGSLTFTSTGLIDTTLTPDFPPLIFDPDGTGAQNNGVDPLQIDLNFSDMTQFAADITAAIENQDGSPQGSLDSISIDGRGVIKGLFTNGVTRDLAQILLANIPNEEGLTKVGDSLFIASPNTGTPVLGEPTERGRGGIASGTLELSNVDLASEFTDLIITQRAFQANARVITTGDEILNELINIL